MKPFFIFFLLFLTMQSRAQKSTSQDSIDIKCEKVFTMCEKPPSLKHGINSYQKLLTNYLLEKGQFPAAGKVSLYLVVSKLGEILDVVVQKNSSGVIDSLVSALKSFPNEWKPGKQNNHIICAYRQIEIEILAKELVIHD